jgi:hypothetical protein
MTRAFFLMSFFLFASVGAAQQHDFEAERTGQSSLTRSGRLVDLVVEPGAKQIRFEIVAKEAAKLKIADDGIEASYGMGDKRQQLKVVKFVDPKTQKTVYVIDRPSVPIENLQIKVKSGQNREQFDLPRLD